MKKIKVSGWLLVFLTAVLLSMLFTKELYLTGLLFLILFAILLFFRYRNAEKDKALFSRYTKLVFQFSSFNKQDVGFEKLLEGSLEKIRNARGDMENRGAYNRLDEVIKKLYLEGAPIPSVDLKKKVRLVDGQYYPFMATLKSVGWIKAGEVSCPTKKDPDRMCRGYEITKIGKEVVRILKII